jgi:hypothetical protein
MVMKKFFLLVTIAACTQAFTAEATIIGLLEKLIRKTTPLSVRGIEQNDLTKAIINADVEAVKAVLAERCFTDEQYRNYISLAQHAREHAEARLKRSIPYSAAAGLVGGLVAGLSAGQLYNHRSPTAQDAHNENKIKPRYDFWKKAEGSVPLKNAKEFSTKQVTFWQEITDDATKRNQWLQNQRWGIGSYVGAGLAVAAGLYALGNALWAPYSLHKDIENLTAIIEALEATLAGTNEPEMDSSSPELSEKAQTRQKMDRVIREMKVTFAKK